MQTTESGRKPWQKPYASRGQRRLSHPTESREIEEKRMYWFIKKLVVLPRTDFIFHLESKPVHFKWYIIHVFNVPLSGSEFLFIN